MPLLDTSNAVLEFDGYFRFLSNFFSAKVEHEGLIYPTAEHAYQASKTDDLRDRLRISKLVSPGAAKRAGQRVVMASGFEANKPMTMRMIVHKKFVQNPKLAKRLLDTHPMFLVEGNEWGDTFWGVCGGAGLNWLGHILMQVREDFRILGLPK